MPTTAWWCVAVGFTVVHENIGLQVEERFSNTPIGMDVV